MTQFISQSNRGWSAFNRKSITKNGAEAGAADAYSHPVLGEGVWSTPSTRWWGLTYSQYSVVGFHLLPVLGGGV